MPPVSFRPGGFLLMNSSQPLQPWEILGKRSLATTRILDLNAVRFHHPRRAVEREFVVIDAPDWVNVVALTPDHELVLVNQYRYGTGLFSWEIPGGVIERGEDPLEAGLRELREETGFAGTRARIIGTVRPNPAIQSNTCHLVLVEEARQVDSLALDEDEEIEVTTRPVEAVLADARRGAITHALVLNGLFLFEPIWSEIRARSI